MRRLALWLVFDGPRLPWGIAPWLLGYALGSKPVRVKAAPTAETTRETVQQMLDAFSASVARLSAFARRDRKKK